MFHGGVGLCPAPPRFSPETWVHRDFYAQECGFSASPRFHIYASICAGRLICACGTSDRAAARQLARPAPRRLPSALRRGKASPQRGNEEKRAAAAGEAASRVRRPAEARSRPTVRRLGCGTPARRGGGASPTTYRGMCRARGAGRRAKTRGCGTTRPKKGEGRAAELDQGGHARPRSGPKPGGTLLGAAACSGRDPDGVLVYAERVAGRARRPSQRASTVAPTEAAGLEGRDGAGGAGVRRSQRSEKGDCLCIKITLHP